MISNLKKIQHRNSECALDSGSNRISGSGKPSHRAYRVKQLTRGGKVHEAVKQLCRELVSLEGRCRKGKAKVGLKENGGNDER